MERRNFLRGGVLLGSSLVVSACGGEGTGGGSIGTSPTASPTPSPTPSPTSNVSGSVIVVGGGMAGATVAKYLKLWGSGLNVTLVERAAQYTSNILSSLVLTGQRTLSSLEFSYATLASTYGIDVVQGEVTGIDTAAGRVSLASGSTLNADKLVLAPGIAFDAVPGLSDPALMPHAWQAGPQTTALADQLAAMPAGGTVIVTIPPVPYRCPPGPYERACLLADWLRVNRPGSKLLVLDANPDIVVERTNFINAFTQLYGNIIEYIPSVTIDSVDTGTMRLFTSAGPIAGDVINLIPRHRASPLITDNGLANDAAGRFAAVDPLSYTSTAAPRVHVIGDASSTAQPKAGHVANQEAKVCADAIIRDFAGEAPDPAPLTTSACFSTITMSEASWLHAMFEYNDSTGKMQAISSSLGASDGWNSGNFRDMNTWFRSLMADTFA